MHSIVYQCTRISHQFACMHSIYDLLPIRIDWIYLTVSIVLLAIEYNNLLWLCNQYRTMVNVNFQPITDRIIHAKIPANPRKNTHWNCNDQTKEKEKKSFLNNKYQKLHSRLERTDPIDWCFWILSVWHFWSTTTPTLTTWIFVCSTQFETINISFWIPFKLQ